MKIIKKLLYIYFLLMFVSGLVACSKKTNYEEPNIHELFDNSVFNIWIYDENDNHVSSGSAFIIKDDGTFVTNAHVVDDAYSAIGWFDSIDSTDIESYDVQWLYEYNAIYDYAIGKLETVENKKYTPVTFSDEYTDNDVVYAVGYPNTPLNKIVTKGNILDYARYEDGISYIETDARIDNGSSGGVLANSKGQVIGITSNVFIQSFTYGSIPVSYFVSSMNSTNLALNAKSLKDYFHPYTEVSLNAFNFESYFNLEVDVNISSETYSTVNFIATVKISPKKYDYDMVGNLISVSIKIDIPYYIYYTSIGKQYYTKTSYIMVYLSKANGFSSEKAEMIYIGSIGGYLTNDTGYYDDSISWVVGKLLIPS